MLLQPLQLVNVYSPMLLNELGIIIVVKSQFPNAISQIAFVPSMIVKVPVGESPLYPRHQPSR